VVFAAAMGWLEGVVVILHPRIDRAGPRRGISAVAEVMRRIHALPWLLPTEQTREIATIAMLAAVGWLAASRWSARLGAFLVIFGVWDITYYVALFALIRWPRSLATMDVLFLVPPHPWWHQPVWVPVAISVVMIMTGARLFRETPRRRPVVS
jgi:hypothetical protein